MVPQRCRVGGGGDLGRQREAAGMILVVVILAHFYSWSWPLLS